ncbi:MAG: hypothetical protein KAW92_10550 [Candidatus Cloacimonetes bacterium]|nr:hypothetical protein [Candidatus Cloacimonadota bacterium]
MSDLSKLKEVLENQQKKSIRSGGWKRLDYSVDRDEVSKEITLIIDAIDVGVVFTLKGRLIGIYRFGV